MTRGSVSFTRQRVIGPNLVRELEGLDFSATGTRRVCLHESEQSLLHVMLVETAPGITYPRHLHRDSDETAIVVRGQLEVVLWAEGLRDAPDRHVLSATGADEQGIVIPRSSPHQTRSMVPGTLYLEIKGGPFDPTALVIDPI